MLITREISFDTAHRLPSHDWKCFNLHGHRYKMLVHCEWEISKDNGMITDFWDLKKVLKEFVDEYLDHGYIGLKDDPITEACLELEYKVFVVEKESTVENLVIVIYEMLESKIREKLWYEVKLRGITLYETPNNYVEYFKK